MYMYFHISASIMESHPKSMNNTNFNEHLDEVVLSTIYMIAMIFDSSCKI